MDFQRPQISPNVYLSSKTMHRKNFSPFDSAKILTLQNNYYLQDSKTTLMNNNYFHIERDNNEKGTNVKWMINVKLYRILLRRNHPINKMKNRVEIMKCFRS